MPKYQIMAFVGLDTYSMTVDAKNSLEANQKALDLGYRKSNFGERYLKGVKAVRIKNNK